MSSAQPHPKILKTNRKTPYGRILSPYDDEEEELDEDEDEDDDFFFPGDNSSMDDGFAEVSEYDVNGKNFKSLKDSETEGSQRSSDKRLGSNTSKSRRSIVTPEDLLGVSTGSKSRNRSAKLLSRTYRKTKYEVLSDEIVFNKRWIPLLDYLRSFGLVESNFIKIHQRHAAAFETNLCSAQERLEYLLSVGVKHQDIKKILMRQPQILQYTVENGLKPRVELLKGLGIPDSQIGQIVAVTPSLFSYSVEDSLKPTIRYLIEEVGIKEEDLGKVVKLSPNILIQRVDISWNTRYLLLSQELGAQRDSVVKMVTKHPQLLYYSIDDAFLPKINFLKSIGMSNSDILNVLTRLPQVLSLSLEDNLKPKYKYLINELDNQVISLARNPVYLSLSMHQRIQPRHQFLVSLKKAPEGPFPLGSLFATDESFCKRWAETSVDKYLEFRKVLLLKKLAKKYQRQR